MHRQTRLGIMFALGAYGLWGVLPIYFKSIQFLGELEILTHRVIWSFLFTGILVIATGLVPKVVDILKTPRLLAILTITSLLVAGNWLLFIWAVSNSRMLDASLGYYINPLVNILFGYIFLSEHLRPVQWLAVSLMICGVMVQVIAFAAFPWIALTLAITFSSYGLLRKKISVDSQSGLFIETLIMLVPALCYWNFYLQSDYSNLLNNSAGINLALLMAGPFTSIPLIFFAAAAKRLRYGTLGFLQYIAPSVMFGLAVVLYDEALTTQKLVTFGLIWSALLIITVDGVKHQRKLQRALRVT